MDTMTKQQIEVILSDRLPNCTVSCSINPDGTLAVALTGPSSQQFTVINVDRLQYHGAAGINRLVREILEEMVITRKSSSF
ncbi:hypothetical protein SAMN05216205_1229 [Pseudomonas mohnii]|uniref:DUF1652 domain-containing protein n=1 Tax=Pseudomonas mohnii TaxID=395600 RepID=A0ABY0XRV5_9PSED|nr:hypothetical protein [Pseudomonas mohnii]SEC01193.1 hypothetical protein SAMN05216205_1229 [Pseudomonas mohnii]